VKYEVLDRIVCQGVGQLIIPDEEFDLEFEDTGSLVYLPISFK